MDLFKIVTIIYIFFTILLNNVFANCTFGLCRVDEELVGNTTGDITSSIKNVVIYILGFIGLISVIWLIKGGFEILTAGGDDEKFKNGKKTILYSLLGILVILIAWSFVSGIMSGLNEI